MVSSAYIACFDNLLMVVVEPSLVCAQREHRALFVV